MTQWRIAALAAVLIAPLSLAHAETVTLVCQQEAGPHMTESGGTFTLRVDYDRKIVDLLSSNGTSVLSATATITEADVRWDDLGRNEHSFMGSLNRLSGRGLVSYRERSVILRQMSGPCRRATQKF